MPETRSEVAIGRTDGYRYIAVKPPLTEEEVGELSKEGLVNTAGIEHVTLPPECSMIRGGYNTVRAQQTAVQIAASLRSLREESVSLDLEPVFLTGFHSSPFNPITR